MSHPVGVTDCVSLRRIIGDPQVSPDGRSVAYIVKHPNTTTNHNEYEIWVRPLPGPTGIDNGHLVALYQDEASYLKWLGDSRHLVALLGQAHTVRRQSRIVVLNSFSGRSDVVVNEPQGITTYSISSNGNTVAYLAGIRPTSSDVPLLDPIQVERGFPIAPGFANAVARTRGSLVEGHVALWISRRNGMGGKWTRTEVQLPNDVSSDGGAKGGFGLAYLLSMAPNGRYLAFDYQMRNP